MPGAQCAVQATRTIMSKHKHRREPSRHRYDDDTVSFAERSSEPSYFCVRHRNHTSCRRRRDLVQHRRGFWLCQIARGHRDTSACCRRPGSPVFPKKRVSRPHWEKVQEVTVSQVLEVGNQTAKLSYVRVALESPPPDECPIGERGHGKVVQSAKRASASLLLKTVRRISSFMPPG